MEYQFRRDLVGAPEAYCSMDHEAIGNWLMTEVGTRTWEITQLLTIVDGLITKQRWNHESDGQHFHLKLTRDQAEVKAALLDTEMDSDEMEGMAYYDNESFSHCGLDDFKNMLESWLEFISS